MLYSETLVTNEEDLLPRVQEAISEIKQYYNLSDTPVLKIDDRHIGIPILINVSSPSGGTVGGIDIRDQEPIVIKINLTLYPEIAPSVISDRFDFPKKMLSHLYATKKEDPARLCLVRGNIHEWFASKRLENFLDVISEWFYKAAAGKLNEDGDEFDPLRLDSYTGYHSYRYTRMQEIIETGTSFFPDSSFSCLINTTYAHTIGEEEISFKSELPVQAATISHFLETLKTITNNIQGSNIKFGITILFWHPQQKAFSSYDAEMPKNYESLIQYFKCYDIDIDLIIRSLKNNGYLTQVFVPIIHAIKRPKKMIGFPGENEFVNFAAEIKTDKKGNINKDGLVINQDHIEPFSSDLAKILTGEDRNSTTLFIGAGSLGSKIIIHDARGGKTGIGICDDDTFLQHNLVRHVLFPNSVGENKSSALSKEIKQMFETEPSKSIKAYPLPVSYLPEEVFDLYNWIVDSTASQNVQNWLTTKRFTSRVSISRCEIADSGKVGLLYIEGENRNPRIDDLVYLTYYRALTNPILQRWRLADAKKEPETLNIGLGCSSISTVMADDTITQHASIFSRLLQNEKDRATIKNNGLIFLNSISLKGIPKSETKFELVSSFDHYTCNAGSGWEIRLFSGLKGRLLGLCKKNKPKETGGILIGICNFKTKSIHIFDIIEAPRDSIGTPTSFIRGVAGLPEKVDQIKYKTGGMIGYVGEWHTHPMQLEALSQRDKDTIEELIPINRQVPIPTLSLIVTNTDTLPFIFI